MLHPVSATTVKAQKLSNHFNLEIIVMIVVIIIVIDNYCLKIIIAVCVTLNLQIFVVFIVS